MGSTPTVSRLFLNWGGRAIPVGLAGDLGPAVAVAAVGGVGGGYLSRRLGPIEYSKEQEKRTATKRASYSSIMNLMR